MVKNILWLFILYLSIASCGDRLPEVTGTDVADFNLDWAFRLEPLGEQNDAVKPDWQSINLPHDWSIELSPDADLEGCTAYLPGGIGFYRKEFSLNLEADQVAFLVFDGIYNNAEISLNGTLLESHPYGYAPFYLDISEALSKDGEPNTLAIKVDKSRYADSRWYSGSGIYRKVDLQVKNKLHIPVWGTFVTTPRITQGQAEIAVEVRLKNLLKESEHVTLETHITNNSGEQMAATSQKVTIAADESTTLSQLLLVDNPDLWDLDTPTLYKAITVINSDGIAVDSVTTTFGIRSIRFDTQEGFFLNGKNLKIKGVCLHHDGGLVGAAVPEGVWRRRLQKLKDAGCNAIRISHNPGSQEFLNLCDEMGFLVQDEFFDEWDNPKDKRLNMNEKSVDSITRGYTEHFQEWAEIDLKNTVLAHRNHPAIIQWSIGNEIEWTYPRNGDATGFFNNMHWSGNYFWEVPPNTPEQISAQLEVLPKGKYDIGKTAQKLAAWTKELDTTRYVTANLILPSSSYESGYADVLDMVGFSYRRILYDYGHDNYPDKPVMGTENLAQWHEWKAVLERPFISGLFLWTGIDYLGESNHAWPNKGTNSGLLNLAGFEKPSYHMFKSLWNDAPHVYIATQDIDASIYKLNSSGNPVEKKKDGWKTALWEWHNVNEHWNYEENQNIIVEVYSNCEEVELFLNEESLGLKKLADFEDNIYKWAVPFRAGTLVAKGTKDGTLKEAQLKTASEATHIQLSTDKTVLKSDNYDVAHIIAQLVDDEGNLVKTENRRLTFSIDGEIKLLGTDTGSVENVQNYRSNSLVTDQGRCLLIVQSKGEQGTAAISVLADDLQGEVLSIAIE